MPESVTVIIPTLGRKSELFTAIASLLDGSVLPAEVIVVDGGAEKEVETTVRNFSADFGDIKFTYIRTEPGLPRQRNTGLDKASEEFVLFLDDDVIVEHDFLKELLNAFEDAGVGGATGLITNQLPAAPLKNFTRRFFLLTGYGDKCILQKSGLPLFLYKPAKRASVQVLNGCNMAFRRKALGNFRFDERINYFDDDDVSMTVGRRWKLVQVPSARLMHVVSVKGRPRASAVADRSVIEQRLLHRKHLPQTPVNVLAYYWSVAGSAVLAAFRFKPYVCFRTLGGLLAVLTGGEKRLGR